MSIIKNNTELYKGRVLEISERYWMDGMCTEYATIWDDEKKTTENIEVGYYGVDGKNLMEGINAEVDCTTEVARDIIKTVKQSAYKAFADSVIEFKNTIHEGDTVYVIRGRKVKKGTMLSVFWIGEKPTYRSTNSPTWSRYYDETELIAGCKNENGDKVWIKAEYLKKLTTPLKSPNARERKKYIKDFVRRFVPNNIRNIASEGHVLWFE